MSPMVMIITRGETIDRTEMVMIHRVIVIATRTVIVMTVMTATCGGVVNGRFENRTRCGTRAARVYCADPTMNRDGVGVDIESQRLVVVLERAVHALELLATVPTPETTVSLHAFLHDRDSFGDERQEALPTRAVATLDAHFRIEAHLARRWQQRRASPASSIVKTSVAAVPPPEEEESTGSDHKDPDPATADKEDGKSEASDQDADDDGHEEEGEEQDWDDDHAAAFPRSLHGLVALLSYDKPTRDALRRLSTTRISPDFAAFVHAATDLIQLSEHMLSTTPEQDAARQQRLQDASQRLRDCQDDAAQLRYELAQARDARHHQALAHVQTISSLREQLADTQRQASDAMKATQRCADDTAHALRTQFDADRSSAHEQALALGRNDARVADAHQLEEAEDRRRVARVAAEVTDVVRRYDDEMAALDAAIAMEQGEIDAMQRAMASMGNDFERTDQDRHYALEEQRAIALAEQLDKRRDNDVFKFVTRMQAVVRGFLVRRHVLKGNRKKKKKTTKKKKKMSPKKKNARAKVK